MSSRPGVDGSQPEEPREERGRSGLRRSSAGPHDPQAALPEGTMVGRYRIVAAIGAGGMGIVYRAEQVAMKREVALKVLHADAGRAGVASSARFEREALAASRITSPHVVTIHDFGEAEGAVFYLAMELLHGESLAQRLLRRGALPPGEAVAIAIQIARALQVAHAAGVVHRDLKPDNIHLVLDDSGHGHVKVLDFGIARLIHGELPKTAPHLTSADLVVGTPLYMSPEACSRGEVGPKADLYSLGVILFEMVTGKPPFDEREPVLLMGRHLEAKPPRMRERRPDLEIPFELEEIVDRLLRKDPGERHASAAALITALRAIPGSDARISPPPIGAAPIRAEPTVLDTRAAKKRSSRSVAVIAGAVLVALIVIAIGVAIAVRPPPEPEVTQLAPLPDPPAPTVRVELEVTPVGATASVDGAPVEGGVIALPRDGALHTIVIEAEGHEPRTITVEGDVDRVVAVELVPIAAPAEQEEEEAAPAPRRTARPRRTAPARPQATKRDPLMREW